MGRRNKKVYMGVGRSTAGIPTRGKVDEDWELLLNVYATAYDSINEKMLTRVRGKFDVTTKREVRARFRILKFLARKYAPHLLDEIEYIENLCLLHLDGKLSDREFLYRLREYCIAKGVDPSLLYLVERKIDRAEGIRNVLRSYPRRHTRKMKTRKKNFVIDTIGNLFGLM